LHHPSGAQRGYETDPILMFGLTDKLRVPLDVYIPIDENTVSTEFNVTLSANSRSEMSARMASAIPQGAGLQLIAFADSLTIFDDLEAKHCTLDIGSGFLPMSVLAHASDHPHLDLPLVVPLYDVGVDIPIEATKQEFTQIQRAFEEHREPKLPFIRGRVILTAVNFENSGLLIPEDTFDETAFALWTMRRLYGDLLSAHIPASHSLRSHPLLKSTRMLSYMPPLDPRARGIHMGELFTHRNLTPLPATMAQCLMPWSPHDLNFLQSLLDIALARHFREELGVEVETKRCAFWNLWTKQRATDELLLEFVEILPVVSDMFALIANYCPYETDHTWGGSYENSTKPIVVESLGNMTMRGGNNRYTAAAIDCEDGDHGASVFIYSILTQKISADTHPGLRAIQELISKCYIDVSNTAAVGSGKASNGEDGAGGGEAEFACHAVNVLWPKNYVACLIQKGSAVIQSTPEYGSEAQTVLRFEDLVSDLPIAWKIPFIFIEGTAPRYPFPVVGPAHSYYEPFRATMLKAAQTVESVRSAASNIIHQCTPRWTPSYEKIEGDIFKDPFYNMITETSFYGDEFWSATRASKRLPDGTTFVSGFTFKDTEDGPRSGAYIVDLVMEWEEVSAGRVHPDNVEHGIILHAPLTKEEVDLVQQVLHAHPEPCRVDPIPEDVRRLVNAFNAGSSDPHILDRAAILLAVASHGPTDEVQTVYQRHFQMATTLKNMEQGSETEHTSPDLVLYSGPLADWELNHDLFDEAYNLVQMSEYSPRVTLCIYSTDSFEISIELFIPEAPPSSSAASS